METSGGIHIQRAGASPAATQRMEQAGRAAWQRRRREGKGTRAGKFSFDLPPVSVAAHSGLRQLCPVSSAALPGGDTRKRLSGCALLHAVPASRKGVQHMGCSDLKLLSLCIFPLERPADLGTAAMPQGTPPV